VRFVKLVGVGGWDEPAADPVRAKDPSGV
jgi:hypothetical protein